MLKYSFLPLLICCTLFFSQKSHCQNEYLPPNVIPPSPEASALFKFTETPVNLSQGMATTEISIYTIQTKGISIPISLNYHARGIKVAELASRVGLGWTLNYGGMISRQVRGKSDDGSGYGYLNQSFYSDFFTNESTRNSVYQMDAYGNADFDPDLFFFSFPGHNGKFIFDQVTKAPWQQKYSDLEIVPHYDTYGGVIDSWVLKDDKGNTFYFGKATGVPNTGVVADSENAIPYMYTSGTGPAQIFTNGSDGGYNSWHLLKIITYEQEVITFDYGVPEGSQYIRRSYDENDPNSQNGVAAYYSIVDAHQYQIKQINFPGGKVVFNKKTTARLDLPGSYALDNIEVYAGTSTLISRHNLVYQDVTSPTSNNYLNHLVFSDGSSHKRMFLKEVQQVKDTFTQPPYIFEYSSVILPNRFSNSQDNWGYYNGANNGQYLTFFDYNGISVDRSVDTTLNSAGLLKKVTYPTGGSVSYEYEQNVAVKPAFLDQTASPGTNPVVTKSAFLGHLMTDKWDSSTGSFKTPVSISENKVSSVVSSVQFSYDDGDGPCQHYQSTAECSFSMLLKGGGNSYLLNYGNNISMAGVPSGEYILEVHPPMNDSLIYFTANLSWEEEEPVEDSDGTPLMLASGKRIKKIIYSDGQNTVKVKEFKYDYPDGSNSGKIFGVPNFYSIQEETSIGNMLYKYACKPGSPLTSLQGNELGYSYVIEYEGTSGDNIGRTEHEFTNYSDGGTYYEFPYHLPIDNQWLRGKPVRTKIFKESGTIPIKEIENEYLYAGFYVNSPSALGLPPLTPMDSTLHVNSKDEYAFQMPLAVFTPDDDQPDGHAYKVYYLRGGAFDLYSTTETSLLGNQEVMTNTTYNYDYTNHYQLKGSSATTHGQTTEVSHSYPVANSELDNANRIIPIETVTSVKEGSTLVAESKQQTLFSMFGSLYLPSEIKSAKKGDSYQPRVEFKKYDSTANPLEVAQYKGPTTVYIWGYNKQNPVAKIENSTYAAVENLSAFGAEFDLGSGGLNATQKSQLRALAGALVTTYDYDPLVGVTIVTDANGRTTTYEYDHFDRLKEIYNHDGHILKQINYHFKNN